MSFFRLVGSYLPIAIFLISAYALPAHAPGLLLPFPPANDDCENPNSPIVSDNFDYGTFDSEIADMTTATGQAGEFFQFAPTHTKSVWYTFSLPVSRSVRIELEAANGTIIPNPADAGVTVYLPSGCLPGNANRLGAFVSSGDLFNPCLAPGTYRIQVTGVSTLNASAQVRITLGCPDHPTDSRFDCPSNAYEFNNGAALPNQTSSETHTVSCHSIESPAEYLCLPHPDQEQFLKSTWYVFTTGNLEGLITFNFDQGAGNFDAGYQLLEGNVRTNPPAGLPQIDCGMSRRNGTQRFIEFPCMLAPNTTYSLALLFPQNMPEREITLQVRQRGLENPTGWPMPILPPGAPANQLGQLAGGNAPGVATNWADGFNCNAFLSENECPPANPVGGVVVIGNGAAERIFDLATWATFSLEYDANVEFRFNQFQPAGAYYLRIFQKTLDNNCPSPDPLADLYEAFLLNNDPHLIRCIPAGEYSLQVLSSTYGHFSTANNYRSAWDYGCLGTTFSLRMTVTYFPAAEMFTLNAPGEFDPINNLDPLANNLIYPSTPAVFVCEETVLPDNLICGEIDRAMYRQFRIGDADGDGIEDAGLLTIRGLRTDLLVNPPFPRINYELYQGDANALATVAGAHFPGDLITGLTNYTGICIDDDDITVNPPGIDQFCACVMPGIYTLSSLGNVAHVGRGDMPDFRFNKYTTIHNSRANAELITIDTIPGDYFSGADVFSCVDNPGEVPSCAERPKLIFREFYLEAPRVLIIAEAGNTSSVLSLFSGRASDPSSELELLEDCFTNITLVDFCTPMEPGWYTLVSYGDGPNYTDNKIWNTLGNQGDVGRTTRILITVIEPLIPMFNRPHKAYQAGVTDWINIGDEFPNVPTGAVYPFETENFCEPDTPFIADSILPCGIDYNRVAFFVFEITKPSFVQVRNVNATFYTMIFPFDVEAAPGSLMTVPAILPCHSAFDEFRQYCDLPPGKYTLTIFANDSHKGRTVTPSIYVDEAALSRFDHAWTAYDFDIIPPDNVFIDGRPGDVHPVYPNQAPSRDVIYCTTGAEASDPTHTVCGTKLNPLIYAQPEGVPKQLFFENLPTPPQMQPWRNLWYTFVLEGAGECSVRLNHLSMGKYRPFMAVYESDADGTMPWVDFQTALINPVNPIIPGLTLIGENVNEDNCNAGAADIVFSKSACQRDRVRYFVVVAMDAVGQNPPVHYPNQAVSLSLRYDAQLFYPAYYDEITTANVINGLGQTEPPYVSVPMVPGDEFVGPAFSLLCYTSNNTDPAGVPPCTGESKSAWFSFEVAQAGQAYIALEELEPGGSWFINTSDLSLWQENTAGGALIRKPLTIIPNSPQGHSWAGSCVEPGRYFILIRDCAWLINTVDLYRLVVRMTDSPGDFCSNAIPITVNDFTPTMGTTIIDCHTIGTDVGEFLPAGNSCFDIPGRKTTWYQAIVNTGQPVDLRFQLEENFTVNTNLNELRYRILSGNCGAMTPIACSASGINDITLNCLSPGSYFIQVSMPERANQPGNPPVEGTLSVTVTATPANPVTCTDPFNPTRVVAEFGYTTDCRSITFVNLSTSGEDIAYLWTFPDGTISTESSPVWTPAAGSGTYEVTLTATHLVTDSMSTFSLEVVMGDAFAGYELLPDTFLCNSTGSLFIDAGFGSGATYLWDDNSTNPVRLITAPGTYIVVIKKDDCEFRDTMVVSQIDATGTISQTLCPGESLTIGSEIFDINRPNGMVVLPMAHPAGCDSIITVALNFTPEVTSTITAGICEGEEYVFGSEILNQSGVYSDTLISAAGCDSIVILDLTVTPREFHTHAAGDCVGTSISLQPTVTGASYSWSHGPQTEIVTVLLEGQYVVSVYNAEGCVISEEIFEVSFGLLPPPEVPIPDTVCNGESISLTVSGSPYNYRWYDAATGGMLLGTGPTLEIPSVTGDIVVYVEAWREDVDGCVSPRVPVEVLLSREPVTTIMIDTFVCAGEPILLPWGEEVLPENGEIFSQSWNYAESGCDSLHMVVTVKYLESESLSLPDEITIFLGDSVRLEPTFGFIPDAVLWTPSEGLSCDRCPEPWAKPSQPTDYQLTAWSPEGCQVEAVVHIDINRNLRIFIPNVFTPNGDAINDLFTVYAGGQVLLVQQLIIFDRWGGSIWQASGFPPNGVTGWDGMSSRGEVVPPGVYVYFCELELIDGTTEVFSGDVTLVR